MVHVLDFAAWNWHAAALAVVPDLIHFDALSDEASAEDAGSVGPRHLVIVGLKTCGVQSPLIVCSMIFSGIEPHEKI